MKNDPDFDEVVLAKDMGFANFEMMIFKYTQYETACACKGQLLRYVYQKYSDEKFVCYIDSDTQVFYSFDEVLSAFKTHSIVFTPHLNAPPEDTHTIWGENAEILYLRVGIINGGFIGLKRSTETEKFLTWWTVRLEHHAFFDAEMGLFTDQRWLTAALVLFDDIYILKHDGYNVAFWNIKQRYITINQEGYAANGVPFRFFHFSNIHYLRDHLPPDNPLVTPIVLEYLSLWEKYQEQYPTHYEWSYSFFDDGLKIEDNSREAFKNNPKLRTKTINPYLLSNKEIRKLNKKNKTRVRYR
ncbi:hypothetical protein [Fictibacillus phosphorivorans]|uniref:hypothetical protein n=1 Tax=Fictibacillus phosphorivorans TaxID=1221500 RepID=UPI0012E783AD|nr:hypothetical protein [Fictibacillus phosphorivorans]